MQQTIDETEYRRQKQIAYNTKHNVTPKALNKGIDSALAGQKTKPYQFEKAPNLLAAEKEVAYFTKDQLDKRIRNVRKEMEKAAKELDFIEAARFRDEIKMLQQKKEQRNQ